LGMLTGWTGRKWDAGRLERSTAPKGSSRMGLSTSCARRRPRPQAGHGFSYAVNSSFPHRDLLQHEFALLQSDFTREVFCYSGSLPTIDLTIGYLLSDKRRPGTMTTPIFSGKQTWPAQRQL
jgi:hypothetical protein